MDGSRNGKIFKIYVKMSRGVVLFAHNNEKDDYYALAVATAKRVNEFLDLPVTLVTDPYTNTGSNYQFDKIILVEPDKSNSRKRSVWINKGRYEIFNLTPYDDTLLIDVDYLINSRQLLAAFNTPGDFSCHRDIKWIMGDGSQEYLHGNVISTLWATVVRFRKTSRTEQLFGMMEMIQKNYDHYAGIYKFMPHMYRNDYALTIALKTVNGHLGVQEDYLPWRLLHVGIDVVVYRDSHTGYTLIATDKSTGKKSYIKVKDLDFHMLNKGNFKELID